MQQHPAFAYQIAIEDVLIQCVSKAVSRCQRAVGQLFFFAGLNQPGDFVEASQALLQIKLIHSQQRGQDDRRKLLSFNTGILKHSPIFFFEGLDLLPNHAANVLRSFEIHF